MSKIISILGSTGSIGKNALEIVKANPENFKIDFLTTNSNVELVCQQALEFDVRAVGIVDKSCYLKAKDILAGKKIEIIVGSDSAIELASRKCDLLISSMVGISGLKPTINAIKAGSNIIGLANKESLVCAGEIILDLANKNDVKIIPIDSEHNAIFQVFDFKNPHYVERLILTASGGPFLNYSLYDLKNVTKQQALNHPRWKMGNKISIDSATMMNKALEIIEAYYLFGIDSSRIKAIIHPESIIHSMVEYIDGSILSQASITDMKLPIEFVMNWPKRKKSNFKLDLAKIGTLNFFEPDLKKFTPLKLVYEVIKSGINSQIIFNASNEKAVELFLQDKIKFLDIMYMIENALNKFSVTHKVYNVDEILQLDEMVKASITY